MYKARYCRHVPKSCCPASSCIAGECVACAGNKTGENITNGFIQSIIMGLILGTLFWQMKPDQSGAQNRISLLFFCITFTVRRWNPVLHIATLKLPLVSCRPWEPLHPFLKCAKNAV